MRLVVSSAFLMASLALLAWAAPDAHAEEAVKIFRKHKCTKCHSISVEDIGIVEEEEAEEEEDGFDDFGEDEEDLEPPDLSGVGLRHEADWMEKFMRKKIATEAGNKHKERFKGTPEELKVLIDYLSKLRTDAPEEGDS